MRVDNGRVPAPDQDDADIAAQVTEKVTSKKDGHGEEVRRIASRYVLQEMLGRGAMGTVWAAYDEYLHRRVAVKEVLLPFGIPDEEASELRERTMREARSIAALSHPNVITLFDVAQHEDEPFVVMELFESSSLATLLEEHGALSLGQAIAIGDAVASALLAAHRTGITHRDVKPGNVLIGHGGIIKLSDFGIARNVADATLTHRGMMLGSPAYISPEVAMGTGLTGAADAWGLGATLYAAIEGKPPYDAGDPVATVSEVVRGPVPVPKNAGPLTPVITGLMVKDPTRRISLEEVRRLLRAHRPDSGTGVFRSLAMTKPAIPLPQRLKPATRPQPQQPLTPPSPQALASDPGPLPWAPRTGSGPRPPVVTPPPMPLAQAPGPIPGRPMPPPHRQAQPFQMPAPAPVKKQRSRGWIMLLALLFLLVAIALGFAGTRLAFGAPLLPPSYKSSLLDDSATASGLPQLEVRQSRLGTEKIPYTVETPTGWQSYPEQRISKVGPSAIDRWVSPSGTQMISVERFPGYVNRFRMEDYSGLVLNARYGSALAGQSSATPNEANTQSELIYRTVEGPQVARTTYSLLVKSGPDLWSVGVTVPAEQEKSSTLLWNRIRSTFQPR
ncbi:serine/threonine protein kinase [Pseudonocardiaceae bacterium YIM PH 21723]|nr:serine/threonine protein kinase [Pseudonocardiaceae bacterium YIM PH 21723]